MRTLFTLLTYMMFLLPSLSWAGAVITYHGRILDHNRKPLEGNISFRIRIHSPLPSKCLLYEETRSITLDSSAQGVFVIPIGDGNAPRTGDDPGLTMEKIFANNGVTIPSLICNSTSSYTPQALDQRQMEVSYDDHSGYGWDHLPSMTLNYVPFAANAHDSQNIGGTPASSILRVQGGNASPLTPTQFTEFLNLLNGSSNQYSKSNELLGTTVPALSNGQVLGWSGGGWAPITPMTSYTETDPTVSSFAKATLPTCGVNQFLKDDGSGQLTCVTAANSGGTITSIAAGSGLLTDQSGNAAITSSGSSVHNCEHTSDFRRLKPYQCRRRWVKHIKCYYKWLPHCKWQYYSDRRRN